MKNDYEVVINVKKTLWEEVFAKTYKVALWDELVSNKSPKEHSLSTHIDGFINQLKLNSLPLEKMPLKKRQIYAVNFWANIGSEIMGVRPALIIKSDSTRGEDVTVIPLTSAQHEKLIDPYDLLLLKDADNKLYQNSYVRLRQIRSVSIKRLGKLLGIVTNEEVKNKINVAIDEMLATDK